MKKICVILALITSFTVNTAVYGAEYAAYGDDETDSTVFSVHFEARPKTVTQDTETTESEPTETGEDTTVSETFDISDTVYESDFTDIETFDVYTDVETAIDTSNETSGDTETAEKTVFGGEGTVKFSPVQLKILSVTPLFDENIGYDLNEGEGFLRFMFYSSAEIKESIQLFDIEFEILSVDENDTVSVTLTEGLFSDGHTDTPCEEVIHTVKAENFSKTTTSPRPVITDEVTTFSEQSSPDSDTKKTNESSDTSDITYDITPSTSPSTNEPNRGSGSGTAVAVIITSLFAVVIIAAGAILVSKKIKKK